MARFLATFAHSEFLRFPIELIGGERPDFVLISDGRSIGVEATEAIHVDQARIDAVRNIKGYDEPMLLQRIRAGEPRRDRTEIESIARGHVSSAGWVGESVESDWADAMLHVIQGKVERFHQVDFRKFPDNWLLIYDNWSLPVVHHDSAAKLLSSRFTVTDDRVPFGKVFIETGNWIFEFHDMAHTRWPLNDLWKVTTLGE